MSEPIKNILHNSTALTCKQCGHRMIGYPGDDICSDCAFPVSAEAEKAAWDGIGIEKQKLARKILGIE
jgi:ribosomal protein L37E